jgi:hypothetical protein
MSANFLQQLQAILPPPAAPIDVDEATLRRNVRSLNTELPTDFLEYSKLYGSGRICVGPYKWEIWSPARASYPAIVADFSRIWGDVREALETSTVPLGLFPEPGGLLPFGNRSDVWFTWKTLGEPDKWKVVVMWSYEEDAYQLFEMGFSEFLVNLLTRRITAAGFTTEWEPADLSFSQDVFYSP